MSIFTVENKQGNIVEGLQGILTYVMRMDAADRRYMYGSAVSISNAYYEMVQVKQIFKQMRGKAYFHYILSPSLSDDLQLDKFFAMGIKVAEVIHHFHGNYQVVMAIHFNTAQYHMHFIANNIDYLTGSRLDLNRQKLSELKTLINTILTEYGISMILKKEYW